MLFRSFDILLNLIKLLFGGLNVQRCFYTFLNFQFLSENIFGEGKYFQVFGYIMKFFLENIFICLFAF